MVNELGPLVEVLPQKNLDPIKVYPNLIKFTPLKHNANGVDQHKISNWQTDPAKQALLTIAAKRAKSPKGGLKLMEKKTQWMKYLHPYEYGLNGDPLVDSLILSHLQTEFSMDPLYKTTHYVPAGWMKCSSETKINFVPYKICPLLPILDENKDKDLRFRSSKTVSPAPNHVWLSEDQVFQRSDSEWFIEDEHDAVDFWKSQIIKGNMEASSSGLSADDKESTPCYGLCGTSESRFFIYGDLWGLPCTSTEFEDVRPITWFPPRILGFSPFPTPPAQKSVSAEDVYVEPRPQSPEVQSSSVAQDQPKAQELVVFGSGSPVPSNLSDLIEQALEQKTKAIADTFTEQLMAMQAAHQAELKRQAEIRDEQNRKLAEDLAAMKQEHQASIVQVGSTINSVMAKVVDLFQELKASIPAPAPIQPPPPTQSSPPAPQPPAPPAPDASA